MIKRGCRAPGASGTHWVCEGNEVAMPENGLALEIHEDGAPPGWDDALRACGGVVFHSEAWAHYKVHEGGGEPLFCEWRDRASDEIVGRALAIRKPPRESLSGRLAAKLAFGSPPATDTAGEDFVSPLLGWARRSPGVIEVTLGSFDALGPWAPGGVPRPRARCEYALPRGGVDEVWTQMRQLARRKVKRAQKSALECRLANRPEELRAFADVYLATTERLQRNKGFDPGFKLDCDRFAGALDRLVESGQGRLYAVYRDGCLEAGTVFATFGDRAYMIYSGATDSGREEGGPFLALFESLLDLRATRHEHINLGGAGGDAADPESPEHGLHQFKTRFGANVEERTSGTLALRPLRARLVEGGRRLVRR
jgi:hypothetical protein